MKKSEKVKKNKILIFLKKIRRRVIINPFFCYNMIVIHSRSMQKVIHVMKSPKTIYILGVAVGAQGDHA